MITCHQTGKSIEVPELHSVLAFSLDSKDISDISIRIVGAIFIRFCVKHVILLRLLVIAVIFLPSKDSYRSSLRRRALKRKNGKSMKKAITKYAPCNKQVGGPRSSVR